MSDWIILKTSRFLLGLNIIRQFFNISLPNNDGKSIISGPGGEISTSIR